MLLLISLAILFTQSIALSNSARKTLNELRDLRLEAAELMDKITAADQMDLVESILDREEEAEGSNSINTSPVLLTPSDIDDTSRDVLTRLREIKEEEKTLLDGLKSSKELQTITVSLLREEIERLEETADRKPKKPTKLEK